MPRLSWTSVLIQYHPVLGFSLRSVAAGWVLPAIEAVAMVRIRLKPRARSLAETIQRLQINRN